LQGLARLFERQDFACLLTASDDLLTASPNHPVGRRARAVALLNLGDPAAAAGAVAGADLPGAADAEAASLLGLARLRLGLAVEARATLERACAIDPGYAPAWANLGAAAATQGDRQAASRAFRRALRLQPGLAGARVAYARLLLETGHKREARASLEAGAELPGADETLHLALARVCSDLHDRDGEIRAATAAVESAPKSAEARRVLGSALAMARRHSEALPHFRAGMRLAPSDPRFAAGLAETQRKLGAYRGARATLARALKRWPDAASLHAGLAGHHLERKAPARALLAARRAVELAPTEALSHATLGAVLFNLGRLDESMGAYRAALALDPRDPTIWNAIGLILGMQGRTLEAVSCFKRGLALDPHHPVCLFSLGLAALALGDWESGWPLYEWRWLGSSIGMNQARPHVPGVAWWAGAPLKGKRLLVLGEQGHGDNLQFVRLLPLLEGPTKVRLSMAKPLIRLMEQSLVDLPFPLEIIERDKAPPGDADSFITLLSLPARVGLTQDTLPAFVPWLKADPGETAGWRKRLAGERRPKVGFVWRGNPDLSSDRWRSTDLSLWQGLLRRRDVRWVSLQKLEGANRRERQVLERHDVIDWTDELGDFAATAALAAALDLVIAVDTSVAHLAGAMGKPVWLLNRTGGEWRWGARQTSSVWYPSMRIFNQAQPLRWDPVLAHVGAELGRWSRGRN
jgi:tetratricopeptide (TPR) repeat protein